MANESAVMVSIRPRWVELIAARKKTVEVRKDMPKCVEAPFTCYIYQTRAAWACSMLRELGLEMLAERLEKAAGKVVGEFICDRCGAYPMQSASVAELAELSCIEPAALRKYAGKNTTLYGWHISELKIYKHPRPLADFGMARAPQSWCTTWPKEAAK